MPELPEVEFARTCLERWLGGETLARVEAEPTRIVRRSSVEALASLAGHRVEAVERRGKQLLLRCSKGLGLAAHLGMTGRFVLVRSPAEPVRWSRARFVTRKGTCVHYQDQRMFGALVADRLVALQQDPSWTDLGPDAWNDPPTAATLRDAIGGRARPVKDLLMDQAILAGIGNIQATEALWRAKVHPKRAGGSISSREFGAIARGLHWTLARTLAQAEGDRITYVEEPGAPNPFLVYGRDGESCPRCRTSLDALTIAGRTSVFCPTCQPAP